jgi:hypothetical protein
VSARAAAVLLVAALGCATGGPHGRLRVELGGPESGPGSAQEGALVEAVRAAAANDGLACQPGAGAQLLRCAPMSLGSEGHGIVMELMRAGTGYSLSIDQGLRLSHSSTVCDVQRRAAETIAFVVGAPAVRVDNRSDCK